MMGIIKFVIIGVLALLFGAFVLPLLQKDPGYILVSVGGITVEMRFWFAILVLVLGVTGIFFIIALYRGFRSYAQSRWHWVWNKRKLKSKVILDKGIAKYAVGDYERAHTLLSQSAKSRETAYLSYMLDAQSLVGMGKVQDAFAVLEKASAQPNADRQDVALLRAELCFANKDYEQCLAILNQLKTTHPKNKQLLKMLRQTYLHMQDWPALLVLAEDMRLAKLLPKEEYHDFVYSIYLAQMQELKSKSETIGSAVLEAPFVSELRLLWDDIPNRFKTAEPLALTYAKLLYVTKQYELLEQHCRNYLSQTWSSEMVRLYGFSATDNVSKQIQIAEKWLKAHPEDASLHYALGKLYVKKDMLGQAKYHMQISLDIQPSAEVYWDLGRLSEQVGEEDKQKALYEQGLALK